MIAETAYNVIQALSEKEYNRLLIMLGVEAKVKPTQNISKVSGLTKAERLDKLKKKLTRKNR